MDMGMYPPN